MSRLTPLTAPKSTASSKVYQQLLLHQNNLQCMRPISCWWHFFETGTTSPFQRLYEQLIGCHLECCDSMYANYHPMSLLQALSTRLLPIVWRLPSLLRERDCLATGDPWNGDSRILAGTVQFHASFASLVVYHPFPHLRSRRLRNSIGEHLHASLSWPCRTIERWPGAERPWGCSNVEPRGWVGIKLLSDSTVLLQQRGILNTSLTGTILDQKTNVRQKCLVRRSRFVGVGQRVVGLGWQEIWYNSLWIEFANLICQRVLSSDPKDHVLIEISNSHPDGWVCSLFCDQSCSAIYFVTIRNFSFSLFFPLPCRTGSSRLSYFTV